MVLFSGSNRESPPCMVLFSGSNRESLPGPGRRDSWLRTVQTRIEPSPRPWRYHWQWLRVFQWLQIIMACLLHILQSESVAAPAWAGGVAAPAWAGGVAAPRPLLRWHQPPIMFLSGRPDGRLQLCGQAGYANPLVVWVSGGAGGRHFVRRRRLRPAPQWSSQSDYNLLQLKTGISYRFQSWIVFRRIRYILGAL